MNLTKEQIAKAKECKTATELLAYANEIGYKLTEEEARMYFDEWHEEGELADDELSNVAGGSTCINGRSYSDEDHGYLITTWGNTCDGYKYYNKNSMSIDDGSCLHCFYIRYVDGVSYCEARSKFSDPYNSEIGYHEGK